MEITIKEKKPVLPMEQPLLTARWQSKLFSGISTLSQSWCRILKAQAIRFQTNAESNRCVRGAESQTLYVILLVAQVTAPNSLSTVLSRLEVRGLSLRDPHVGLTPARPWTVCWLGLRVNT